MKELTFKEVIANIKEGEEWKGIDYTISKSREIIYIGNSESCVSVLGYEKFQLKRKEVTFQEAFAAYEKGKEIESIVTDYRYRFLDGKHQYFSNIYVKFVNNGTFDIKEIIGGWYIND